MINDCCAILVGCHIVNKSKLIQFQEEQYRYLVTTKYDIKSICFHIAYLLNSLSNNIRNAQPRKAPVHGHAPWQTRMQPIDLANYYFLWCVITTLFLCFIVTCDSRAFSTYIVTSHVSYSVKPVLTRFLSIVEKRVSGYVQS